MQNFPEEFGEPVGTRFVTSSVAGLQFYEYNEIDEISGKPIRPEVGDRIELVREPRNRYDKNAIEVRFKNGQVKLGHVPAELAEDLAPIMDAGKHLRAYAVSGGNGHAWSSRIIICSDDIPEKLHRKDLHYAIRAYERQMQDRQDIGRDRAKAWKKAQHAWRKEQIRQTAEPFVKLAAKEHHEFLTNRKAPDFTAEDSIGKSFWNTRDIPKDADGLPQFRTKEEWALDGFKVKKGQKRTADWEYKSWRYTKYKALYGAHQVEPLPPPDLEDIEEKMMSAVLFDWICENEDDEEEERYNSYFWRLGQDRFRDDL
ncbi:HIRAN domain-containing protein [Falsigemmobacter intermedius]|uniref:HIRAN domain-containing protein n=1 Tax=Falsigemmobacter intermedius TaxID=1553448 RepID=A0A3S3U4S5_9RHOB|nr:HIRAN domain-containing protein [Falsigemmobacter intermedius]RWY37360.1 hypothetical protein EP867_17395 [Falsigemmobacter intermedius]